MNWKENFPNSRIFQTANGILFNGDTLETLRAFSDGSVDMIVTSPPYWGLRDYGVEGQLGLEKTMEEYIDKILEVTVELKRVLKKTGVMFWNHGDCYGGNLSAPNQPKLGKRDPYSNFPRVRARNRVSKCLVLQNYRLVLRMIDEQGWILRNNIVWYKPNHMPSSAKDRFTNAYEPVFFFSKSKKYSFDLDEVRVPSISDLKPFNIRDKVKAGIKAVGYMVNLKEIQKTKIPKETAERFGSPRARKYRKADTTAKLFQKKGQGGNQELPALTNPKGKNPGDIWTISTQPFPEAHFATYPEKLVEPMIKAGCPKEGIVLDPFMGAGTTGVVAEKLDRKWIGIELNRNYCGIIEKRIRKIRPQLELFREKI